jgi:hypothetical protein
MSPLGIGWIERKDSEGRLQIASPDLLKHAGEDGFIAGIALTVSAADEVSQESWPSGSRRVRPRRGGP